ncbi:hypothetical protein DY000_02029174 [Brassica cretica]|uniref:Uncharacterized protein n=1 Tax=Brassica cretica TaxID=69181 RepID=A0ABQ7DTI9_BRACR|nr:hypothetical protein DY000_02029174 [Brassica cretica]
MSNYSASSPAMGRKRGEQHGSHSMRYEMLNRKPLTQYTALRLLYKCFPILLQLMRGTGVLPCTPRNLNTNNCHVEQKCFPVLPQLIRGTEVFPSLTLANKETRDGSENKRNDLITKKAKASPWISILSTTHQIGKE